MAVDLPGFGRAEPLLRGRPVLPQLDAFAVALLAETAANGTSTPPVIVGNSLGGVVGLRALEEASLPLGGVVAVSPAGLGIQPWLDVVAREPVIHRLLALPLPPAVAVLTHCVIHLYHPGLMATWVVDPHHTRVSFSVRLLGLSIVEGRFREVHGSATFDPRDPASTRGVARVGAASVDTGDERLDADHRGPDVFDAERHPYIVFVSRSVSAVGRAGHQVIGDLTIRGITRRMTFDIEYRGIGTDPRGRRHAGLTLSGVVDRADFGLTRSLTLRRLVGTRVGLRIEARLVEQVDARMVA
jgi:polyisoprenoid-binding protein YceI